MTARRLRHSFAVVLCLALCAFAFATAHTAGRGRKAMAESDRSFHAGQLEQSVRYARRAALLYVPGASHVDEAYRRMTAIARGAEVARDKVTAALAWRAVRSAAVQTAHGWSPQREEVGLAERGLSRLTPAFPVAGTVPHSGLRNSHSGLLSGFFLLSLGAGVTTVWLGMSSGGQWQSRRALLPAVVAMASAVLWGASLLAA